MTVTLPTSAKFKKSLINVFLRFEAAAAYGECASKHSRSGHTSLAGGGLPHHYL